MDFPQLVCFDIDGTITTGKHTIPPTIQDAIQRLIDQGIIVLFSTGRNYSLTRTLLQDFHGEYYLALQNGTSLYREHEGNLLRSWSFDTIQLRSFVQWVQERTDGNLLVVTGREAGDVAYFSNLRPLTPVLRRSLALFPERMRGVPDLLELDVPQVRVIGSVGPTVLMTDLALEAAQVFPGYSIFSIHDPFDAALSWFNILPHGASKGQALRFLADTLGIAHTRVAAVGNDSNDLDMLDFAAHAAFVTSTSTSEKSHYVPVPGPDQGGVVRWLAGLFPHLAWQALER